VLSHSPSSTIGLSLCRSSFGTEEIKEVVTASRAIEGLFRIAAQSARSEILEDQELAWLLFGWWLLKAIPACMEVAPCALEPALSRISCKTAILISESEPNAYRRRRTRSIQGVLNPFANQCFRGIRDCISGEELPYDRIPCRVPWPMFSEVPHHNPLFSIVWVVKCFAPDETSRMHRDQVPVRTER
jgi:hypothetical protein